ncbi:type II secretion system protein [bacterium]|jgi:prepilin-type N-terminal cleavage/methylation domain-containing protein|nr:type II secretion system protein [bacterium]
MKKNLNSGFTLIELVIIMVILGVLAAVAVPRLGNTIDSSEQSAEEAVIGSLRSAVEVYAMDQVVNNSNKSYPSNPFDALDDKSKSDLLNNNWYWGYNGNDGINHIRNDGVRVFWYYSESSGQIQYGYTDD